ncbi:MAG: hypothetical protein LBP53_04185 [Candidatus Peribacteria bacterium]|nr:hypothetical protein [Candidatus Peribacteria bacterium]
MTETVNFYDIVGNAGSTGISITRIDKAAVTGTVHYSVATPTKHDVLATVTFAKT